MFCLLFDSSFYVFEQCSLSENPESYRKGQYLVANAFWNVSSNLQVGVEYLRGWRTDFSSSTRPANRLNMLVQYSF